MGLGRSEQRALGAPEGTGQVCERVRLSVTCCALERGDADMQDRTPRQEAAPGCARWLPQLL